MRIFGSCMWIANIEYEDGTIGDCVVTARTARSAGNVVARLMDRNGRIREIYPLTARETWVLNQTATLPATPTRKPAL